MLAQRLKQLRQEKGVLQKDVATQLNISTSAYGFYEQGKRTPDIETLELLSDYFDVSVDYLLGRTDDRCHIVNESELSVHERYALKIADALEKEGLEYTEDLIEDIISFTEYFIKKNKKQDN